ncbi:MAG: hypothetical protein JSS72_04375 [Armatimonadetes bacterium]|nr:hypothetical protein [Armatimonadota bacterium]
MISRSRGLIATLSVVALAGCSGKLSMGGGLGDFAKERMKEIQTANADAFYPYVNPDELYPGLTKANVEAMFQITLKPVAASIDKVEFVSSQPGTDPASGLENEQAQFTLHFKSPNQQVVLPASLTVFNTAKGAKAYLFAALQIGWMARAACRGEDVKDPSFDIKATVEGMKEDFPQYRKAGINKIVALGGSIPADLDVTLASYEARVVNAKGQKKRP